MIASALRVGDVVELPMFADGPTVFTVEAIHSPSYGGCVCIDFAGPLVPLFKFAKLEQHRDVSVLARAK